MKMSHMRWTDPLSGQTLLAGTIPADASTEAKAKAFSVVYDGICVQHGKAAADTLRWDKGEY